MPELTKSSVGRPRRFVPPEQVQELRREGLSFREIARKTGFGYGSVRRAYVTEANGDSAEILDTATCKQADAPVVRATQFAAR
jgi:hypothetical protein